MLVNAFQYALLPSHASDATAMLSEPEHLAWRNKLLSTSSGPSSRPSSRSGCRPRPRPPVVDLPDVPLLQVPHPSSRDAAVLANKWKAAITQLRGIVTPDPDGDNTGPNYGDGIKEADYAPIPGGPAVRRTAVVRGRRVGRTARPRHNNSVDRPAAT